MMTETNSPLTKPVIAGNWKMNKGPEEAREFCRAFAEAFPARVDRTVLVFPPAISLLAAVEALRERPEIGLGVQNIHWEAEGAFTGEISAPMARSAGARFTLVGHSERRHIFGETDEDTRRKVAAAFQHGLIPVLCVGEKLEEREAGRLQEVLLRQLDTATEGLDDEQLRRIVVAYEPVWAIGTGVNATPDDAAGAHAILRARLAERLGEDAAGRVPILYGGSVNPKNAASLLAASDVDGLLIGGASLAPDSFAEIAST